MGLFRVYVWDTDSSEKTRMRRPVKIHFSVPKTNVREIRFSNVRESPKSRLKALPLRAKNERTGPCTMAEQSDDKKGGTGTGRTQGKKRQGTIQRDLSTPIGDTPDINEDVANEPIQVSPNTSGSLTLLGKPALKRELTETATLSPSLASPLDDWIKQKADQGTLSRCKIFHDENISNIKEKLNQIISQWEFIRIPTAFGQPIDVPPLPDLFF